MEEHLFSLMKKGTPEEYLALYLEPNGDFIEVENPKEVSEAIIKNSYPNTFKVNVYHQLKCKVEIRPFTEDGTPLAKSGGYIVWGDGEIRKPIMKAVVFLPSNCPTCDGTGHILK